MQLSVLFIDFNSYFASVEQALQPRLRGKPVAVVPVMTDHTCAIAASYEAKAYGVKTGTSIRDAKRMCPGLICVLAQHQAYVHYHHKLRDEIDKHLPVLQVESIDEMSCQLWGPYQDPTSAQQLARQVKAGIARNVSPWIGSSIGLSTNRFLAKVASDLQKPDGLTILHPNQMPHQLSHLTPQDLPGIGPNMAARLQQKGIHTISQLYNAAPKQLLRLWGSIEGERFWYALRGHELQRAPTERSMVTHSHVLSPKDRPLEKAENVGRRLLLKAASRMRQLPCKATALTLSVRVDLGPRLEGSQSFPSPISDSFTLLRAFTELWQKVLADRPPFIKKVSLALHGLLPADSPEQLSLFPNEEPSFMPSSEAKRQACERLSNAMDSITERYGRQALTLGLTKQDGSSFTGTKIAFTRIPEKTDFEQWQQAEQHLDQRPTVDEEPE
jgi:DNA polymerase IV